MALEPLAIGIRTNKAIERIQVKNVIAKMELYADDVLYYLRNPPSLIKALSQLILEFSLISG